MPLSIASGLDVSAVVSNEIVGATEESSALAARVFKGLIKRRVNKTRAPDLTKIDRLNFFMFLNAIP
jgi:hypothetical protein